MSYMNMDTPIKNRADEANEMDGNSVGAGDADNAIKTNRPPVVAVVGHIDHGKSRLQQALRKMDTDLNEAGDITQHIGAYEIHTKYEGDARRATVIDTPGHEAFSHIREHGLELADIALLVISSEEGVKDQTKETYAVIQKTNTPCIIVFTKTDTEKSNLESAKMSALQNGILLEKFGGSLPWVAVSSIKGTGIQELLDLVFLTTDVCELTEDRKDGSVGVLVEVDVDKKVGIAGTVLVLQGKIEGRKYISVGRSISPLRIIENDRGKKVTEATPSTPVRVIGFDSIPNIGKPVFIHESKKEATEYTKKFPVDDEAHSQKDINAEYIIPAIIRSDTASGLTSIENAIRTGVPEGIAFKIIKSSVGEVTEEDMRMALAEGSGRVVGFHTEINSLAQQLADKNPNTLFTFSTIYEVIDWAKNISQKEKENYEMKHTTGTAKVIRMFESEESQGKFIIGAQIVSGEFQIGQDITVIRGETTVGRFAVKTIQQHSKDCDNVSGLKTQFASKIKGEGKIQTDDIILGLPILS